MSDFKDEFTKELTNIIKNMNTDNNTSTESGTTDSNNSIHLETITLWESISDYSKQTGKRFRMTKEQKERGISREEAFTERFTS
jgi:hypothetical protein